jgi:hypothetical protein
MTILDPILYANGALRLTRHGKGRGDTVLVHAPSGLQVAIPEPEVRDVERVLDSKITDSADIFRFISNRLGVNYALDRFVAAHR